MHRPFKLLVATLLVLVSVSAAEAGPIIYFDSYRSLTTDGFVQDTTATGAFSVRGPGTLNRSHNSFIGETIIDSAGHPYERIRAAGNLNAIFRNGPADLETNLFTTFQLDRQYTANLSVSFTARRDSFAEGFLFDENTQTMLAQVIVDEGLGRLLFDGVLEPGLYSYYLLAQVDTLGGAGFNDPFASFSGDLNLREFSPVPEPGTMTLLGLGLAAAWRRRKR